MIYTVGGKLQSGNNERMECGMRPNYVSLSLSTSWIPRSASRRSRMKRILGVPALCGAQFGRLRHRCLPRDRRWRNANKAFHHTISRRRNVYIKVPNADVET